MNITFVGTAPREILQIDDAKIIYRNFTGAGSKFNREGDRNFSVKIEDQDIANALIEAGYNVKIKAPRMDGDMPFMSLPVKIKYDDDGRGPTAYLKSGDKVIKLDSESIGCIDDIDILEVDLDIRPYDWEVNGKTGRSAYLQSIHVTQKIDRFAARYED